MESLRPGRPFVHINRESPSTVMSPAAADSWPGESKEGGARSAVRWERTEVDLVTSAMDAGDSLDRTIGAVIR